MKIQVRRGVFETNSSSVHTLTMCEKSLFDSWKHEKNDVWLDLSNGELIIPKDLDEKDKENFSREMAMRDEVKKILPKIRQEIGLDEGDYVSEGAVYDYMDTYIFVRDRQFVTYNEWCDYCCNGHEDYIDEKVINGVNVVAFGFYGCDY